MEHFVTTLLKGCYVGLRGSTMSSSSARPVKGYIRTVIAEAAAEPQSQNQQPQQVAVAGDGGSAGGQPRASVFSRLQVDANAASPAVPGGLETGQGDWGVPTSGSALDSRGRLMGMYGMGRRELTIADVEEAAEELRRGLVVMMRRTAKTPRLNEREVAIVKGRLSERMQEVIDVSSWGRRVGGGGGWLVDEGQG